VIDALLGTGLNGSARGKALEWIREINTSFPNAKIVAVDVPSGMSSDTGRSEGEIARADVCVTFTAPKVCHVLPPNCNRYGELIVGRIGSPDTLMSDVPLHSTEPADFVRLLQPRASDSNKGDYGHVLIVGGAPGKTGAAEMAGLAALRVGAGLSTVASSSTAFGTPEMMHVALPASWSDLQPLTHRKRVVALGPGLGTESWSRALVRDTVRECKLPLVLDADALNVLSGSEWDSKAGFRVITPHPGEMARLLQRSIEEIQAERITSAKAYSAACGAVVVLKGYRTVIAFADGRVWINPTGSPALAKGGTGDVLTGLMAGMLAQWPNDREAAVLAAVYLHGLAGQRAARAGFEACVLATDILQFLPEAMRECSRVSDVH
jgi:NAD(P)H-hydrate epimerase